MQEKLKILFASSDKIALKVLEEVYNNFDVGGVLSSSSVQHGRKRHTNPITDFAIANNIPIFTPEHILAPEREEISKTGVNFLLSFSYSKIFGPKFLALFTSGTMNIHPSLLPLYRGPSPLQASLLNNDKQSGISFQSIALKMDEGDIYYSLPFVIEDDDDIVTIREKVSLLAAKNIKNVLNSHLSSPKPQVGTPSYTSMICADDGKIDWQKDEAWRIVAASKAFALWPRCFCLFGGKKLFFEKCSLVDDAVSHYRQDEESGKVIAYDKALRAFIIKAKDKVLALSWLMLEGKKSQSAPDFKNGHNDFIGSILE